MVGSDPKQEKFDHSQLRWNRNLRSDGPQKPETGVLKPYYAEANRTVSLLI